MLIQPYYGILLHAALVWVCEDYPYDASPPMNGYVSLYLYCTTDAWSLLWGLHGGPDWATFVGRLLQI